MALDAVLEDLHQPVDVGLEADAVAHFHEVLAAHLAVLGVVEQEVGELGALLHKVDARQALHLFFEAVRPEQLAEDDPGVVEAQRLIEIAREQVLPGSLRPGHFRPPSYPPKVGPLEP